MFGYGRLLRMICKFDRNFRAELEEAGIRRSILQERIVDLENRVQKLDAMAVDAIDSLNQIVFASRSLMTQMERSLGGLRDHAETEITPEEAKRRLANKLKDEATDHNERIRAAREKPETK